MATLLAALVMVESGGDNGAIAKVDGRIHARGPLQITQAVVVDFNKAHTTSPIEWADVNDPRIATDVFNWYMAKYGYANAPEEVQALVWHLGPTGYHQYKAGVAKKYAWGQEYLRKFRAAKAGAA